MIPAAFEYHRPESADEALALLAEHGDGARLLAGGHSLLPLMRRRLARPAVLVDVSRLQALSFVVDGGNHVAVGALTRHRDLETSALLAAEVPILAHAAGLVGDPQVRNRGTFGGSLAHADPAADLAAVALALGATLVVRGPFGEREIAIGDFFRGAHHTALGPTEMLCAVRLPKVAGRRWSYQRFSRRAQDWATVAVAAVGSSTQPVSAPTAPAIGLAGMGPVPLRATAAEKALASGAGATDAAALADRGTAPVSDVHASADYRRHLARVLVSRATEAMSG